MRRIGFFLLFLTSIATNFFLEISCEAEDFSKKNKEIILAQVTPAYYMIPPISDISYQNTNGTEMPVTYHKNGEEYPGIDLSDRKKFPPASHDYKHEGYW